MAAACGIVVLGLVLLSSSSYETALSEPFSSGTGHPLPGGERPSFSVLGASEEQSRFHHVIVASACGNVCEVEEEDDSPEFVSLEDASRDASTLNQFKHRSMASGGSRAAHGIPKLSTAESALRNRRRIRTLYRFALEKNQFARSPLVTGQQHAHRRLRTSELPRKLVLPVTSWASVGYGEYLADVFVGKPPRLFSVIVDTGSDLSWLQSLPCYNCFEQRGFYYPALSSSYSLLPCADNRCRDADRSTDFPCISTSQPCSYFVWYGHGLANSTGNLAFEDFSFGLEESDDSGAHRVDGVIFGCGHRNVGFYDGVAGILGLGRGPLSFSSQVHPLYGGVFSYCLADWQDDPPTRGKLVFGEDSALMTHPNLTFTPFVAGGQNSYYYVRVKEIKLAGEILDIPPETWELSPDGRGGAIIDSGTTLSRFACPAFRVIREAWQNKFNKYPVVAEEEFPYLSPCFNVSRDAGVALPDFTILFGDGAAWNFPPENLSIRPRKDEVLCLAALADPPSLSMILGNYQQQNFHVVYDLERSRLGFAPARCADA